MSRIGIFGGTFNPPHNAHKYLALEMKRLAKLDRIIVIPTFVPPHKQASELQGSLDRLEMCRLTFTEPFFSVSDIEISRKGKSYTVDTLETLKKLYPDDELFLIVGSDMLFMFDKWYRFRDILSLATLCVASRENTDGYERLCRYARDVLGLDADAGEIIIAEIPPVELSSTQIRQSIKDGDDASALVAKDVLQYIKEKGFYK